VISICSRRGAMPRDFSRPSTMSSTASCAISRGDTLMAMGTPARLEPAASSWRMPRHTSSTRWRSSGSARPVLAAAKITSSGEIWPWRGWFQRISASRLCTSRASLAMMGWYHTPIARASMACSKSRSTSRRVARRWLSAVSNTWKRLRPVRLASYSASSAKLIMSAMSASSVTAMPMLTPRWPP
jgi:hypothetical protein